MLLVHGNRLLDLGILVEKFEVPMGLTSKRSVEMVLKIRRHETLHETQNSAASSSTLQNFLPVGYPQPIGDIAAMERRPINYSRILDELGLITLHADFHGRKPSEGLFERP